MSRIRTIKPAFWKSKPVSRVSLQARLLFIGLWNEADDEGRMHGAPKAIAGVLFQYDEDIGAKEVRGWLDELEAQGLIQRYDCNGAPFIFVCGLLANQKLDKRYPSHLPPPPPRPNAAAAPPDWAAGPADEQVGTAEVVAPEIGSQKSEVRSQKVVSERASAAPPLAPSEPPQEPEKPNPEPEAGPRDAGGIAAVAAIVSQRRHGVGGREGFEESFTNWYSDVETLLENHGAEWRKELPMLDGKHGRPKLDTVVRAKWGWFKRDRYRDGQTIAIANMAVWLAKEATPHRYSWDKENTTVVDGSAALERTRITLLKPLEGPHPSDDPEAAAERDKAMALMAGIGKPKPKVGRTLPAERAPSGGVDGSGAPASTAEG